MALRLTIDRIHPQVGQPLSLAPSGLTLVVGANNVGKSRLLRDVAAHAGVVSEPTVALTHVDFRKEPPQISEDERFVDGLAAQVGHYGRDVPYYRGIVENSDFTLADLSYRWNEGVDLSIPARLLLVHLSAGSLIHYSSQPLSTDDLRQRRGLLVRAHLNPEAVRELADLCARNFKFRVTWDGMAGSFEFRVGEPEVEAPPANAISREYLDSILELPALSSQGDGVRSFLGLAAQVLFNPASVFLVDEPEAFLHPPQARSLGNWLARTAVDREKQVIVATHDKDFLLGALDSGESVHVVRVDRDEKGRTALFELRPEDIQDLWDDPITRYSNILEGIFHEVTIITESDGDCRFFRAVLDKVCDEANDTTVESNTLFVPSHGKDGIAKMVRALSALGVKARVIADFDVLDLKSRIRDITSALGGDFDKEIEPIYQPLLDEVNRRKDKFESLKHRGISDLRGDVLTSTKSLLDALDALGLVVIPVGEMEDLDREHAKPGWVNWMLENRRHAKNVEAQSVTMRALRGLL